MKLKILHCSVVIVFATCAMPHAAEPSRDLVSTNRMERLASQSDIVALVRVPAIDFIGKPTKVEGDRIVADVYIYGSLVSMQIMETYKSKEQTVPQTIYVFQKGGTGLGRAWFEKGGQYIVYLKGCSPPDLVTDNVNTSPALPRDSYYSVIQERKGVIAKSDTKAFLKMDESLRAKMKPAARPASPPTE